MFGKKIYWLTLFFVGFGGNSLFAQNNADIVSYINTYKEISMTEMQRTGIPASIILAQGIHETEAGTSELVRKSNNHFGIKCKENWTGSIVYHDDDERGECFRSYGSAMDSYRDHSDFLKSSLRYQFLFKLDPMNYAGWAYGLKKAGYATNSKYSQILIRLIRDYNLQQYTLIAMGKLNPSEEMIAGGQPVKVDLSNDSTQQRSGERAPGSSLTIAPPSYPEGVFTINNAKVIFAKSGSSLLSIADQYDLSLPHIIDFNELKGEEVLVKDQLIFLQRKRKTGANEYHTVIHGETLYDISQAEGIRYESLLELNHMTPQELPAAGVKLYLQKTAATKPSLAKLEATTADSGVAKDLSMETANPITHIVQTKETLYSISKKYGVDVEKIQEWNKLDSMNLRSGQELIIYKY